MSGSTVLIVDDERTLARAVKAFLTESGYEAEVAGDAEQALEMLETLRPDVVFSDVRLPGMNGIDLLRRIREFDPGIAVVIMTAHGTIEGAVEAVKLGAFDYLKKPVDLEESSSWPTARGKRRSSNRSCPTTAGRRRRDVPSAGVLGARRRSGRCWSRPARSPRWRTPPVLITGETGTGRVSSPGRFTEAARGRPGRSSR